VTLTRHVTQTDAPRPSTVQIVARDRVRRTARRRVVITVLVLVIGLGYIVSLVAGQTFYTPAEVLGVIMGRDVPGASFTVGRLRLPRASLAVLAGLCFGMGGVTFQTMLRNPLASPDIIGSAPVPAPRPRSPSSPFRCRAPPSR
jgi:iron complex transport system permease protein